MPSGGKTWWRPKADFVLSRAQRKEVLQWIKMLMFPDGYATNLSRRVNLSTLWVLGMKSHDFHIWIEQILLCVGTIWGGIQQPSWIVRPIVAPVQPPTSMRLMFLVLRLQNLLVMLYWILMFVFDTYVRTWDLWGLCSWYLCLCWELGYLCLCWILMSVMISVMYMWCICGIFCLFGWNRKSK
jgi:hypothetical protein